MNKYQEFYLNDPCRIAETIAQEKHFREIYEASLDCILEKSGKGVEGLNINFDKNGTFDYFSNCICTNSYFDVTGSKIIYFNDNIELWIAEWKVRSAKHLVKQEFNVYIIFFIKKCHQVDRITKVDLVLKAVKIDNDFIKDIDCGKIKLDNKSISSKANSSEIEEKMYIVPKDHSNILTWEEFIDEQIEIRDYCSLPDNNCCN